MKTRLICLLVFQLVLVCCSEPNKRLFTILHESDTKITFNNNVQDTDSLNILDYLYFYNGGGLAVGDINNDGLSDIFFSGNLVKNRLYLNKGNMLFEDITDISAVGGESDWNSGAVMADVNGDGLLDIYVCAVVGVNGFKGRNELFINNGDGTFDERAKEFSLDFQTHATMASFFDYDLDGDLDMYLLNHAVHNVNSFGKASIRNKRTDKSGDKLLRNDAGIFVDVSEEAGIYGGGNGYGLGLAIADFDRDGFPDIYVGNDFHEDDYFYKNNGDGTFDESGARYFGHFSKFSMGNDVADINHDGFPEIMTLDMLPDDEGVLKSSAGDDNQSNLDQRTQILGYHPQYSRNMLQLNRGGDFFSEVGLMANISATDWSWSVLFADFDLDSQQDLFVSNGIPKRPNDLDYINFISNEDVKKKLSSSKEIDVQALDKMPVGIKRNKFFKGNATGSFSDETSAWAGEKAFISNGSALADLDNDGDIDIVTNNLNNGATIYRNNSKKSGYLKIKLRLDTGNTFGLGAKISLYDKGVLQYKELFPARGFQSSSEPILHFGVGQIKMIDSLVVEWPNKNIDVYYEVQTNQTLLLSPSNRRDKKKQFLFNKKHAEINFKRVHFEINPEHKENKYIDFNRQKLIPYKISQRGPALTVGDFNGDNKQDFFFGGSKLIPSRLYFQKEGNFVEVKSNVIANDSICEDETAIQADFNGDGRMDIFVGSGGGEFTGRSRALLDRLYLNTADGFVKNNLPEGYVNTSVVKPCDFDGDGDLDLFIGVSAITSNYGKLPSSYILKNSNGVFIEEEVPDLKDIGMVTDALWSDFDGDDIKDLIIVGEWMSPVFLKNKNGTFINVSKQKLRQEHSGLWRSIEQFDIDFDDDMDYLIGNWGLNSKFRASKEYPMRMYYGDFDDNLTTETIVATEKGGNYFPINNLDQLSSQLESLIKKKYPSYKSFSGRTVEEVVSKEIIEKGVLFEVNTLTSGFLENNNGNFSFKPFEQSLQTAPINCFLAHDFNSDGQQEVLVAGNFFGSEPYHGRFDAFEGAIILDKTTVVLGQAIGLNLTNKVVNDLKVIEVDNKILLVVTVNNGLLEFYQVSS